MLGIPVDRWHKKLADDYSITALKAILILIALFFIMIAIFVDNPWILAGAILYEALP